MGEELGRRDGLLFGSCLWNLTPEQRIWGRNGQNQLLWTSLSQFFPVKAGSGIGDGVLMFHIVSVFKEGSGLTEPGGLEIHRI